MKSRLQLGLTALAVFLFTAAFTQTTISTYPTLTANNGSSAITFEMTTSSSIFVTGISTTITSGATSLVEIWYRPGGVLASGQTTPTITTANGWILAGSVSVTSTSSTVPIALPLLGMSIPVNAGTPVGFCLNGPSMRYVTYVAGATTDFTGGNATVYTGVGKGFGGTITSWIATRQFAGSVTFVPAGPCVNPPYLGTAISNKSITCAGETFTLSVDTLTSGTGQTYQWQSSPNGTTWTNIAGATGLQYQTSQTTTTYYRCQATCTATTSSASVVVTTSATALAAGTYTINGNFVTGGTNFNSFSDFKQAIVCGGIAGPVVVNVIAKGSAYNEQVAFGAIGGASATNTITINGNGQTLSFGGGAQYATLLFNGSSYFKIKNLKIEGTGTASNYGVQLTGGSQFIEIDSCTVSINPASISSTTAAFVISGSLTSATTAGNNANNITVKNSIIEGGYYCFTMLGPTSAPFATNNIIENNTIRDFYLYGFYCTNQNNSSIKYNDINRSQRTGTITTFYGMYFNGNMTGVQVVGNKIHNNADQNPTASFTAYSMYMSGANASASAPMLVANNALYELQGVGTNYAIYLASGNFINLYHNTVSIDNYLATTSSSVQRALFCGASSGTFEIKNNIFQMNHAGTGAKHLMYFSSTVPTFSIDYNQLYQAGTKVADYLGYWSAANISTFAAWQAVNSGAFDANSTYGDAVFALDYFTPQSAVGNNNGTNLLSVVPTDINGVARTASPDKGVVEYVPLTCLQPFSFAGSSTSTTINLSWTNAPGADSVHIEYGPSGFTQGTGLTMFANSTALITGLFPNTCYDFYLTSYCGGSIGNGTGLFVYCTACGGFNTPFTEGFETPPAGSTTNPSMPTCWGYWENPAATTSCYGYTYAALTPIGTKHFRMYNFNSASDTLAIISPEINGLTNGDKRIKFWAKTGSATYSTPIIVGTTPSLTDMRNATIIDTIQSDNLNYATEFTVNIATAAGYNGTDKHVFLMHTGTPVSYYIAYLDDITIETVPLCAPPFNQSVSNTTSSGTTVNWSSINGTCFKMEYGPQGFIQGTGQGTIVNNIAATSYAISGLSPNTNYDVYLADCCNPSAWVGPFTFKTNCTTQLSGIYTVGGTPGATNFTTLTAALAALNGCGVTGPVTFNIQAGTHTIPATTFASIAGVNATNTVTFNGGSKTTTTVAFNAGSTIALSFDAAQYITFKNLTISAPASDRQVWLKNNSHHITFDYCDIIGSSTTTSSLTCVIAASATNTSISSTGNNANYITVTHCKLVGGYYGFSTYGSGTTSYTSNFVVTDNEFVDQYYYPIRFYYAENITLERNDARVTRNTAGYGLYAYYVTNATIKRNKLFAPTYAMYMYNSNFNASTSYVEISNNFLGATTSYGLYISIPNNVNIYHNSVRGGSYATYITGAASNVNVKNNIFESNSSYAAYIATTPTNFTLDYNIYNTGGTSIAYQGAAYTTLAAWKTGQPSYNASSIQGNPGYASTSDFHIIGTLPNNVGLNGLALQDIDGDVRPASGSTTVDIGADEFTPLSWDVQAAGISEPEDLSCGDSTTVIKAVFSNFGLQTITSVSATAYVTGSTTATLTGTFSGSVPSLGQDTIVMSSFNSAAGGTYNIEVVFNLTGDQDASNDTVSTVVNLNDVLARQPLVARDSVCAGQYDTLYFPSNLGNLSFQWLTTNGDTISDMDSLIVGPMGANDTTFIMNALSSSFNVGPLDNSIGASANYTAMNHYLQFTVTNPTTIKTVDVIANGAGLVDVVIQDGTSFATLFTHTVAIPAGGNQTLVLNQQLAPGTYRMGGTTVNNAGGLQRNSAGASYPYVSPDGSVSITGNTFSATYYYFFYNWEIGAGGCPRPDGEVTIYNAGNLSAAFTSNLNPPTMTDLTVDFNAGSSIGATSYAWDFGDGSNGSGATPSHTYLANGTYTVTLLVTGPCGVDTISHVVVIAGIGIEESLLNQSLNVFPNPNNGKFRVEFQVEGLKNVELRVSTMLGQEVFSSKPGNISGEYREELDLSDEATGVYILQIVTDDNVVSRRITIRK